jgi:hypothetical protein
VWGVEGREENNGEGGGWEEEEAAGRGRGQGRRSECRTYLPLLLLQNGHHEGDVSRREVAPGVIGEEEKKENGGKGDEVAERGSGWK